MALIIKIMFLIMAVLFYLASLSANDIKRAYLELTAAMIVSVLLIVSMTLF